MPVRPVIGRRTHDFNAKWPLAQAAAIFLSILAAGGIMGNIENGSQRNSRMVIMMIFYISSRLNNRDQVRVAAELLKSRGWTHAHDWTNFDLSREDNPEELREIAQKEYEGVKKADVVLVITPQGRGTHVELGMAAAFGKKIYLYHTDDSYFKSDGDTCAFYWLPQVTQLSGAIENAVEFILTENTNRK